MSGAGGAQGLEFGPFTQDITKFKRVTTARNLGSSGADPDLLFTRKSRLVEGFYQVVARVLCFDISAVANGIQWEWSFPQVADPTAVAINITASGFDLTGAGILPPVDWSGDAGARYTTIFGGGEQFSLNWDGLIFLPEPSDALITWAPTTGDASVDALSYVRLKLIR